MENLKVSVIIPAYNTEHFIDNMLECCIKQTYKNIEIIVVNDGSTDNTLLHIQRYADLDKRITYINITNSGVSNARNLGLKLSSGEKIFFWDSDDIVEFDAIEKCVQFATMENVNSVLYGYSNRVNGINGPLINSTLKKHYRNTEIRRELIPHFIGHSFNDINTWIIGKCGLRDGKEHTALWRIMLDAKILKDYDLLFDTNLSIGEDTIFINRYFLLENSIGYLNECLYHLTLRKSGANITNNNNPDSMLDNKIKLIHARSILDRECKNDYNWDLHYYWEGTMVLSTLQLLIKYASLRKFNSFYKLQQYINLPEVSQAIQNYTPPIGIKAIPFIMLKFKMEKLLYTIIYLMPPKIVSLFTKNVY